MTKDDYETLKLLIDEELQDHYLFDNNEASISKVKYNLAIERVTTIIRQYTDGTLTKDYIDRLKEIKNGK